MLKVPLKALVISLVIFFQIFSVEARREVQELEEGADLSYSLDVSLEDAASGKTIKLDIPSTERCDGHWQVCSYCQGQGVIRAQQGFFQCSKHAHIVKEKVKYTILNVRNVADQAT